MWTTQRENVPDILYHYCDIDTFIKIIENKTIRLSNIFKMNDYSEVLHVLDILPATLYEEYLNCNFPFQYKGKENKAAFDEIMLDINRELKSSKFITYIACFSEHEDNLGQWGRYGDEGRGVAIGYDGKMLYDLAQECSLKFADVNYLIDDRKEYTKRAIVPQVFSALKEARTNGNVINGFCSYENMVLICALSSISAILLSADKYKHEAYAEEKEWRMCFPTIIDSFYVEGKTGNYAKEKKINDIVIGKMSFVNKRGSIVSHFDLKFDSFSNASEIIKRIIIGPKSRLNEQDSDLKLLLQMNGFNVGLPHIAYSSIQKSKIPYI